MLPAGLDRFVPHPTRTTPATAAHLVSFEGIDGAGKSTLVSLTEAALSTRGVDAAFTREETATFLGDAVRRAITHGMDPVTIVHLFLADRYQHLVDLRRPLEEDRLIVTDRYHDSTRAYQGVALAERFDGFEPFEAWLGQLVEDWLVVPNRTYLLDIDPETAIARLEGRKEQGGYEKLEFLTKVQKRYRELAESEPDRWVVLDATASPTRLVKAVVADLEKQGIIPSLTSDASSVEGEDTQAPAR